MPTRVAAIIRAKKIAFLDDGSIASMSHFVDRFGDETEEFAEAVSALATMPDGSWVVVEFDRFVATVH